MKIELTRPVVVPETLAFGNGLRIPLRPELVHVRGVGRDMSAAAVCWLCSDEASYMTGAIVNVSGGRELFVRS